MCGLSIETFWSMTLKEINLFVKVMGDKRKRDLEEKRMELYNQAVLISTFVSLSIGGKQLPRYSEIFTDSDIAAEEKEKLEKQRQAITKDAWLAWADSQNQFWHKKHKTGSEIKDGDTATSG